MAASSAIVNITSIEAHQASPGFAVYGAMKAALAQFTEIANDLRRT
jgi:NAD(P)-dependent dehydrogenase (short-subunit alcohol dehydrogenase family)